MAKVKLSENEKILLSFEKYQNEWSVIVNELNSKLDKSKWSLVKSNNWVFCGKPNTYYQHNSKDLVIQFINGDKNPNFISVTTNHVYHYNGQVCLGWEPKRVKTYSKVDSLCKYANKQ